MLRKRKRPWILALVPVLIAAGIFLYKELSMKLIWQPQLASEGTEFLQNPERGWYRMAAFELSETPLGRDDLFQASAQDDNMLILTEINLKAYQNSEIGETGLENLRAILAQLQDTGKKGILRFLYDWDGNAKQTEPENLSLILRHMEQVGPVLLEYESAVYTLQGVFLGSWGEMHTSRHLSRGNVKTLLEKLESVTGSSMLLSVRTPAFWRSCTGVAGIQEAFGPGLSARLGLYNDGLLGSASDLGTYADEVDVPAGSLASAWGRRAELSFQNSLCLSVPNGGETSVASEYTTKTAAAQALETMRLSYLSREHSPQVLESWKAETYTGSGAFSGQSFFDYVGASLGYRYVAEQAAVRSPFLAGRVEFSLSVKNVGFAPLYREKQVELLLISETGGDALRLPIETDVRTWLPGATVKLSASGRRKELSSGRYQVYLKLSEDSCSPPIALANEGAFREEQGANLLGTLEIEKGGLENGRIG